MRLTTTFILSFFTSILLSSSICYADNDKIANKLDTSITKQKNTKQKTTLEFSEAWARQSIPPNNNSALYIKINNPTNEQITIIGASAISVANNVELHESFVDEGGISRMVSVDNIVIPANSEVELKPASIHIMLFDLKKPLKVGEKFYLSIKIENMDTIEVEADIK